MHGFRKGLFATLVAIAIPLTQASAATSSFDGTWNVRISSSSETCGNGATVAIGINNGQIASSSAAVTASGRVADGTPKLFTVADMADISILPISFEVPVFYERGDTTFIHVDTEL